MTQTEAANKAPDFITRAVEVTIRVGLLLVLVAWCFQIVRPFITPLVWAIIIAVAVYPLYLRLVSALGGRQTLAATLLTLVALVLLITPVVMISNSTVDTTHTLAKHLSDGTLQIPPPSERVAGWPLIGEKVHQFWSLASDNLEEALAQAKPEIKAIGEWLLSAAAGVGAGILQFIISLIIAGVLLANAEGGARTARLIATRVVGKRGEAFTHMAGATVRSVAVGVLGIAVIQALLSGIGLVVMGIPAAGLWAFAVLLLAIMQLPPILVLGPIMVYVFSVADTVPAVLFTVYGILVSASDGILKPLLLGRGLDVPMLVILLGAIGGMMLSGIIGLFVGAVVLAVGYELLMDWLNRGSSEPLDDPATPPGDG